MLLKLRLGYDDVTSVEFARMDTGGTKSRTFDLVINVRGGDTASIFSSIPRDEYTALFEFLKSKNVHIINAKALSQKRQIESTSRSGRKRRVLQSNTLDADNGDATLKLDEDEDEEDDEDFASAKSSSSDSEEYDSKSEPSGSDGEGYEGGAAAGASSSKGSKDKTDDTEDEEEEEEDEEEEDEEDDDE
jgi:structure-specific recognition protein 1